MKFCTPYSRLALVVLFVLVLVLAGSTSAQTSQPPWAEETLGDLELVASSFNQRVSTVDLGVAESQLRNERVNLYVTDTDGSEATFSFRMGDQNRITELRSGTHDDATVRMTTDRATVARIATASDRPAAFRAAVVAGDIHIVGLGLANGVLWAIVSLVLAVIRAPLLALGVAAGTVFSVAVLYNLLTSPGTTTATTAGGGSTSASTTSAFSTGPDGVSGGDGSAVSGHGPAPSGDSASMSRGSSATSGSTSSSGSGPSTSGGTPSSSESQWSRLSTRGATELDRLIGILERLLTVSTLFGVLWLKLKTGVRELTHTLRRAVGAARDAFVGAFSQSQSGGGTDTDTQSSSDDRSGGETSSPERPPHSARPRRRRLPRRRTARRPPRE